jgi:hypothetical protein
MIGTWVQPPEAVDHLEAVDAGQAEVENDHVGSLIGRHLEGFLAGGGEVDLAAPSAEVDGNGAADLRLVIDHQHAADGATP